MQLLHVFYMQSLRLAPKCNASRIYLVSLTWELDRSFSTRSWVHQASYTADTRSGCAARALTISDHVMYNFLGQLGESSDSGEVCLKTHNYFSRRARVY